MPTNLTDVDSFDTVTGPSATDIRNAAAVRGYLQTLANRTRHFYNRLQALADFAALKAINTTGLPDGTTRIVKGQGVYSLDTGSAASELQPWTIAPTTGPGRWISATAHPLTRVIRVWPGNSVIGKHVDASGTAPFSPIGENLVTSDASINAGRLRSNNVSAANRHWYAISLDDYVLDGATLTSAVFNYRAAVAHSVMPANVPYVAVGRTSSSGGASLLAAGSVVDPSANLAALEADHTITFTPDQNNVIDRSQFGYIALIGDVGGANAVAGSADGVSAASGLWKHIDLTFTVPDGRGT